MATNHVTFTKFESPSGYSDDDKESEIELDGAWIGTLTGVKVNPKGFWDRHAGRVEFYEAEFTPGDTTYNVSTSVKALGGWRPALNEAKRQIRKICQGYI